jgi:hypothetical protein
MSTDRYRGMVRYLTDTFGEDLQWVVTDQGEEGYRVRVIRSDLEEEYPQERLERIAHRSLGLLDGDAMEHTYPHLGDAYALAATYELGTLLHVFLPGGDTIVIATEPGTEVTLPEFARECAREVGE